MGYSAPFKAVPTIVSRPRPGDAIGDALRDAFSRTVGVPDDMMVLLARLNGNERSRPAGEKQ
jgi:hypothetical protein